VDLTVSSCPEIEALPLFIGWLPRLARLRIAHCPRVDRAPALPGHAPEPHRAPPGRERLLREVPENVSQLTNLKDLVIDQPQAPYLSRKLLLIPSLSPESKKSLRELLADHGDT